MYSGLDCPEPALSAAVSWALARLGGQLRADPAPATDDFDAEWLLDEVKRWSRVRDDRILDPQEVLAHVVAGIFGITFDEASGRVRIGPSLPAGWRGATLRRVRSNRSLFDVGVRVRSAWVTVRLKLVFGPDLSVLVSLRDDHLVSRVTADEVPLSTSFAILNVHDEHEVILFLE